MTQHPTFPSKNARLAPLEKALAAVHVVEAALYEGMSNTTARAYIRRKLGLSWDLLSAFQYLSGKEAVGTLESLPEDWVGEDGTTKQLVAHVVAVAHQMYFELNASAGLLTAEDLVAHIRRTNEQNENIERELLAELPELSEAEKDHRTREGLADVSAGRTIPHEEVERRFNELCRRSIAKIGDEGDSL